MNVDCNDTNASYWNALIAEVKVTHGGVNTYYTIFSIIGSDASPAPAARSTSNFTAQTGDSITISITGRNTYYGSGTVVRFSNVHLWQNGA